MRPIFPSGGDRSARSRSSRRGSRGIRWRHTWQDESEPDSIPEATTRGRAYDFLACPLSFVVTWLLLLAGCATRQVNSPIAKHSMGSLHQFQRQWHRGDQQDLVILAFSGGG